MLRDQILASFKTNQGVETELGDFDKPVTDSNLGALGQPAKAGVSKAEASKEVAEIFNDIM